MNRNGMSAATIVIDRLMTMKAGAETKKVEHDARNVGDSVSVESKGGLKAKPADGGGKGEETPFPAAGRAIEHDSESPKTRSVKKAADPGEGEVIASEIKGTKARRFVFIDE